MVRRQACKTVSKMLCLCAVIISIGEVNKCRAFDFEVSAEIGLGHVDVLDLHVDGVNLLFRLLSACKPAAPSEVRGGVVWHELAE